MGNKMVIGKCITDILEHNSNDFDCHLILKEIRAILARPVWSEIYFNIKGKSGSIYLIEVIKNQILGENNE